MMNDNTKMRVAVVTSTYARSEDDCQVPWMRELLSRVEGRVESIRVFAPSYKGLKNHTIDGISVNRFRYAPKALESLTHDEGAPNKTRSLAYKILAVPYILCGMIAVIWWCVKYRIQVLHIHWPFPHGLWAIFPKYLLGVNIIAMNHGAELAIARRSSFVKFVLGWLLRSADIRCANSSHTANEVSSVCGKKDTVITPYGATVAQKGKNFDTSEIPMLLFCGRLIQRKGIDVLLKSIPLVLKQQQVQVVITGEGDCKEEWMKLSEDLGLKDVVKFAGFVSNQELADLYNQCSMYVHPAIFDDNGDTEGLGVVLIEALSYKKPVVASGVGGILDVIKHEETGLLVPEKDVEALAIAIRRILSDSDLAFHLGEKGYSHVKRFFDWDRIANQTVEMYQSFDKEIGKKEVTTLSA
tara:strand:- start:9750 stop:10982 length:1233 start_codon:yes stop_codon:yes gene_type:complete